MSPLDLYIWLAPVFLVVVVGGGGVLFSHWSERRLERLLREEARRASPAE